jgi:NADPH:quinone reductase-like Zn-dependent oxidoreductase
VRAVVFAGAGGNEVVRLEERPDPVPGPEDVLVDAPFAGLNPADLLQRAGRYPAPAGSPPDVPGLEVAGTVVACGERVSSHRVGDRVFGLVGGGGLADRVVVHERAVTAVPERLDDREAAAAPEAFVTAHDAVCTQAGLRPGERLLVHGAAGGVGLAAVQVGLLAGAHVVAVVRTAAVADRVAELGAEVVAEDAFPAGVGEPADVVLELVGALHFPANLDVLAQRGRIVVVGVAGGSETTLSLATLMAKRASLRGTVLRARPLEEKGAAIRAFAREVVPALAAGRVRAVVDSVYPVARVADAFDRLASQGKLGKVLLDFTA